MLRLPTSPQRTHGKRIDNPYLPLLAVRVFLVLVASWLPLNAVAAEGLGWEFEPYRIDAVVALDVAGGLAERLASELPRHLEGRAVSSMGPTWLLKPQIATGVQRHLVLSNITTIADPPAAQFRTDGDKLLLIAIKWQADGFEITAREFDRFVQKWGMPLRRDLRQADMLGEQAFALASQAVASLARFEPDPNDSRRVLLQPRAAALARPDPDATWTQAGDVFLPMIRRTTRSGELVQGGAQPVPWTYIEAVEVDGDKIVGRVHSGTRQPLPARRQGRIEPIAIALRADPGETTLRLESRTDADKPLVGYDVFAQDTGEEATTPIALSDAEGRVQVPAGGTRVQIVFVKNGGQLLARFPLVPGAESEVDVPLPDDDMRLAAEARLATLREEVVDVVARRNILMARARQKINEGDFAAAQELLQALDELPGRAQFNLTLTTAMRLLRSDDPQMQRRIDQLFEATRAVVNQYLDVRPISDLHNELREARRKKT